MLAAALALTVVSCTCPKPYTPVANDAYQWTGASAVEGRRLFMALCAGCHGARADGNSPSATILFPKPRDLTSGVYRFRSTTDDVLPLRSDLVRTIALGMPGTAMPSWRDQLSQQEIMSVVVFLESLSDRFADDPPEPDDVEVDLATITAPPRTPELLTRGRKVYERMDCGECHGPRGRGDGPAAGTLLNTDKTASDLFDFTSGDYKGGNTPAAVYRTFITGLEGTPMPSFAEALPEEMDRWALVYYCLSLTRKHGLWFYLSERPTWQEPLTGN